MLRLGESRLTWRLRLPLCCSIDQYSILLTHKNTSESFCVCVSYSSTASRLVRERWFESFLKLLLSLKRSHLSSLLISAALEWVRETLNCPFSSADCNKALLCAWVMGRYEGQNCPNNARKSGYPHQALITFNSSFPLKSHLHCSTCNSDPSDV